MKFHTKKHVARSGSAYIDVDGEHYLTRDGKKTVSTVFFRFSDHDANYGEPDNDTYLADVFPGGDTVETAIKRLGEVGGCVQSTPPLILSSEKKE